MGAGHGVFFITTFHCLSNPTRRHIVSLTEKTVLRNTQIGSVSISTWANESYIIFEVAPMILTDPGDKCGERLGREEEQSHPL